ncbi:hypothetical protein EDB83DRAFT_2274480 [Lactarius deliciosus]|nr:hypothetical protein EDB83DRAFT_2274480 [Lactarius deliciosus]
MMSLYWQREVEKAGMETDADASFLPPGECPVHVPIDELQHTCADVSYPDQHAS